MSITWTHCPICQCEKITIENNIGKCKECGHSFRASIPDEIMPKYYEKQYWNNDKNRQGITTVKPDGQWDRWVGARLKILESFDLINHDNPNEVSILEFGCAEGMLLYALKTRGYRVMGNEICAVADESIKELGIEISRQPVEEFAKCGRKFDLIMSFHVVEHLRDPLAVMKSLSSMMQPGGGDAFACTC